MIPLPAVDKGNWGPKGQGLLVVFAASQKAVTKRVVEIGLRFPMGTWGYLLLSQRVGTKRVVISW